MDQVSKDAVRSIVILEVSKILKDLLKSGVLMMMDKNEFKRMLSKWKRGANE